MNEIILDIIELNYKIKASFLRQIQGGWSAYAYKVSSEKQDYFLKVYDKHRHTTQNCINNIENYMPVALWLFYNTQLRDRMAAPIFTISGSYKCENEDYIFILFPFIDGITLAEKTLTQRQQQDIAEIVAELHFHGRDIPIPTENIVENFDVTFCDKLLTFINKEADYNNRELSDAWEPYKKNISECVTTVKGLAKKLCASELNYVMCHTDIHGWNLMQADRLILIDWEGVKIAPAEADLFAFTDGFFYGYAWDKFISVYKYLHPEFKLNENVLRFYRIRRRLEDIHDFAASILYDSLSQKDQERSLKHMIKECLLLD